MPRSENKKRSYLVRVGPPKIPGNFSVLLYYLKVLTVLNSIRKNP